MKKLIAILILTIFTFGCKSCGVVDKSPNIREQPGAEACPIFCDKMQELGSTDNECKEYLLGEKTTNLCIEWCVSSQKNSIQLNPACMAKVSRCDQVDCASRISPDQCLDLDSLCP